MPFGRSGRFRLKIVSDAPFDTVHAALVFALNFGARDHGVAAAAERSIALFARERYENLPMSTYASSFKGVDGAAQAGLILSRLSSLPPLSRAALEARFAIARPQSRMAACAKLALAAHDELSIRLFVLENLFFRANGLRIPLGTIADRAGVTDRTARRWQREAIRWLRPVQQRAIDAAEDLLQQAGVVSGH